MGVGRPGKGLAPSTYTTSGGHMAAKPNFRIRTSALAVIATTIGFLAFASAALADTGTVYFDGSGNAAAGDPNALFNGSFTGAANVGLGREVMQNLTSG